MPTEIATFFLPPNETGQWINTPLWHRPSPEPPMLALVQNPVKDFRRYIDIVNGYPEQTAAGSMRIFASRHILIDGYPGTVITEASGSRDVKALFVYIPEQSVLYTIGGQADNGNFAQTDSEMQAIITSFHIEKAVPSGGRQ